jgi:hypothetical protein
VAIISFTAASATPIRTMLPHPSRRLPVRRCTGNNGMLPAGPQAMRTGAEESEARVVMLHKQGGLFRIIVQNIHEKVSDRFDTRGVEILTPASVGKEFLSGDVPPSPSSVRSLRPSPGDHRRRGRPDRDPLTLTCSSPSPPPNGSRQLTDAEAGLDKHDASPPSPRLRSPPARAASIAARRT